MEEIIQASDLFILAIIAIVVMMLTESEKITIVVMVGSYLLLLVSKVALGGYLPL